MKVKDFYVRFLLFFCDIEIHVYISKRSHKDEKNADTSMFIGLNV